MSEPREMIQRELFMARVLCAAFGVSLCLFGVIAVMMTTVMKFSPIMPENEPKVGMIFSLVAIFQFVLLLVLQSFLGKRIVGETVVARLSTMRMILIVKLAVCDSAGVIGLLQFMLFGNVPRHFFCLVLGLVGIFLIFPRQNDWEQTASPLPSAAS